jgi:hypothetical protein
MSRRGISKSKFTDREDARLRELIGRGVYSDWSEVANEMPGRNARQCRERWNNYVNPKITIRAWTEAEEELLVRKYAELGPQWQVIVKAFPNRSKNQVKNHWSARERRLEREAAQATQQKRKPNKSIDQQEPHTLFPLDESGTWIWGRESEFLSD